MAEYHGGLSRVEAERQAEKEIRGQYEAEMRARDREVVA
jgi:hypothetical protein